MMDRTTHLALPPTLLPVAEGTLRADVNDMYVMSNGCWQRFDPMPSVDTRLADLECQFGQIQADIRSEELLLETHPELAAMRDKYLFMKKLVENND